MSIEIERAEKALEAADDVLRVNAETLEHVAARNSNAQAIAEQAIGWALLAIAQELKDAK